MEVEPDLVCVLTKVEGGFALRPSAKLTNDYFEVLNLTEAAASTSCAKQETRRESEQELDL